MSEPLVDLPYYPRWQEFELEMMPSKPNYKCVLHPDREATHDPQGLLVCDECWANYQAERERNMPFAQRVFLQRLIRVRHELDSS